MPTEHRITVDLTQRVNGFTFDDLEDLSEAIRNTIRNFIEPEFPGDETTILHWKVTNDQKKPGLQPKRDVFPRRFSTEKLGYCNVRMFDDPNAVQYDYVFVPNQGVFNMLNQHKFDKTDLCRAVDEILRGEGYDV